MVWNLELPKGISVPRRHQAICRFVKLLVCLSVALVNDLLDFRLIGTIVSNQLTEIG